ncbi:uncharacterized protein RAG0_06818 [Rhynchosporium agropyri]|uniref:Frequency clock protein n=1 Tax=Rhynchosporium agropyri TaxID=914238 RepID=A0A1E1KIS9_9HELO|nr:uncharacterized protein RAG0_06818 [Rhynchosporium agropyri]
MVASSGEPQSGSQYRPHPRRPPPQLSVSLRHNGPVQNDKSVEAQSHVAGISVRPLKRLPSDESYDSSEGAERWFDHANKRPGTGLGFPRTEDDEPPYFLPHDSSKDSKEESLDIARLQTAQVASRQQRVQRSITGDSSVGDYRSVIDDLTIENRKLKQEIRKLKKSSETHLQKDRLFDVRIHGKLSARKRRELEELLGSFASNIDDSTKKDASLSKKSKYTSLGDTKSFAAKHSTSSSTSNSRPLDSAYASMSTSGPTSLSTPTNGPGMDRSNSSVPVKTDQSIHNFLHNIPEGLLPKHSPLLTERQKKKLVVQKLEELFTGRKGIIVGDHSQPLQQQEVSASAAKADRAANHDGLIPLEGLREAHILPYVMDVDSGKSKDLVGHSGNENTAEAYTSDVSGEASPEISTPGQRPTRPLDLDPDRAQVPSENIDYIRHLGLSTPKFNSDTSSDSATAADADGWIYLNLLVSMAQLHIINVTPDFVREALLDVSEKFQVSRDGKRVKWRGGTQGTRMGSDDMKDFAANQTVEDSYSLLEPSKKRRKVDGGHFAPVPIEAPNAELSHYKTVQPLHYKPLFKHAESFGSSVSSNESESPFGYDTGNEDTQENGLVDPQASRGDPSQKSTREKQEAGVLVYYAGAKFYTDLSGDPDPSSTPLHFSGVSTDGHYSSNRRAIGQITRESAPPVERTQSGSLLPFRPFKDYSKGASIPGLEEPRPRTPELLDEETDDDQFVDKFAGGTAPLNRQQDFDSTGLGGTRPADHFIMKVETRRTTRDGSQPGKQQGLASSASGHKKSTVPRSTLDSFFDRGGKGHRARYVSFPISSKASVVENLPVQTEILSLHTRQLEPSELPPPLGYHTALDSDSDCSDSDSDGDGNASSQFSRSQNKRTSPQHQNSNTSPKHPSWAQRYPDGGFSDGDESDNEEDDGDGDGSIDILAEARKHDPEIVAAKEMEFEMAIDDKGTDAATVNDSIASTRPRGLRRNLNGGLRRTSTMSMDEEDEDD